MDIESKYIDYYNYVKNIENIDNFKSNSNFQKMLEHVTYDLGIEYLLHIKDKIKNITFEHIKNYCILNDKIGGGIKYDYNIINTSPSNFRYILHANLILNHIQKKGLNNIDITEIGGGYGGLCLAINYFSKIYNISINSYNIIDLPAITVLQNKYLSMHDLSFKVNFFDANNFGNDIIQSNMFLISNYCFSEISKHYQNMYIKNLFSKITHGFMAWNIIDLYDFGFKCESEKEYPLTGHMNKYVYF